MFALSPENLNADNIVNLNTKIGKELYNKTTDPLAISFNGDSKNINLFLN